MYVRENGRAQGRRAPVFSCAHYFQKWPDLQHLKKKNVLIHSAGLTIVNKEVVPTLFKFFCYLIV